MHYVILNANTKKIKLLSGPLKWTACLELHSLPSPDLTLTAIVKTRWVDHMVARPCLVIGRKFRDMEGE